MKLRPRQVKLKKDIYDAIKNGYKRILCVAPCGFGKTILIKSIVDNITSRGKKILFFAPRSELIEQCSNKLKEAGISHSILNDPSKYDPDAPVQLTCWQFINGKDYRWQPDVIIYDECHGSVSEKVAEILNKFKNCLLLGFTATPYRDDGKGLNSMYDILIESCQTSDLINEGFLIKPEYYVCKDQINTKAITFENEEEIDSDEADHIIKADLIRNFKNICPKARTVVFCPSMKKAEEVAEKFRKAGHTAHSVDAKTPKKLRKKILQDFKDNKFQILTNAMLLKEGWDEPELECVIILRNLKSRVFFRQGCGRVMRVPKSGTKKAFILDFYGCIEKFGLPWEDEIYSLTEDVQRKIKEKIKENNDSKHIMCLACQQIVETSTEEKIENCPYCGFDLSKVEKIVAEAIADLEKVDEKKVNVSRDEKQIEYNRLCAICMQKNYNPVWVSHKYKDKFKVWPRNITKTDNFQKYIENHERSQLNQQL